MMRRQTIDNERVVAGDARDTGLLLDHRAQPRRILPHQHVELAKALERREHAI